MSKEENRGMINAYEQMLKDGSAFKEVDLTMHTTPDVSEATGARGETPVALTDNPMGEPLEEYNNDHDNEMYGEFNSVMEQKMNSLKSKIKSRKSGGTSTPNQNREILSLKKRVARLEEALALVMETHEQLLS